MSVTASGQMTDSEVLGGRIPELTFDAKIAGDAVQGRASGSFEGFDPAVLSGRAAAKGTVAGRLDVDAEMTNVSAGVTPESVEGTVRMTLAPSTIGDLQITCADVDADYRMRTAEFRKLEVVGRDANVNATGTLALNETDQSNLTLHADTPSLEEVGKIVGMPLTGIAKVDATITGNRTELQANGTLVGSGVTPRQRRVVADDDLRRAVPEFSFDRAAVDAKTDATFVTVAGQNVNELTATTKYADQRVEFDAVARQPDRTLNAAGELALHPEHQEVHLQRLALDTRGQEWQLAPGSEATVRYGGDAIVVEQAQLVSGDQRLTAEGASAVRATCCT